MQTDVVSLFERALKERIAENAKLLAMSPLPVDKYHFSVGVNNGLSEAIDIIKKTAADLIGDNDAG